MKAPGVKPTAIDEKGKLICSGSLDQHFTPRSLGKRMVEAVRLKKVCRIGDFAAGDGQLLRLAGDRWPAATRVAVELDCALRKHLDRLGEVIFGDFRDPATKARLREALGVTGADLVILNPPFSMRAKKLIKTVFCGIDYSCSIALSFVVEALDFLRKGGEVVAVLPHGVVHSERDCKLLKAIGNRWCLYVLDDDVVERFNGCDVRCVIIRIRKTSSESFQNYTSCQDTSWRGRVLRGAVDHTRIKKMNSAARGATSVIHTTNLVGGELAKPFFRLNDANSRYSCDSGAVVLIPRVGRIKPHKVVVLSTDWKKYQYTSCILLIKCINEYEARAVRKVIEHEWNEFIECFGGTGASYTTISKVTKFLNEKAKLIRAQWILTAA